MKRIVLFFIAVTMLLCGVSFNSYAETFEYSSIASVREWELLYEINTLRQENGKAPVNMLVSLQDASGVRSKELLTNLSHYRPDSTPWYSILESNSIEYNTDSFEIIAANFTDAGSLLTSLSKDEDSSKKLLSDYTHIGIGFSEGSTTANFSSFCIIGIHCRDKAVYSLCNTENIHLNYKDSADKIDITLKGSCSHGTGYAKVLPQMISGYDPEKVGTQVAFVKFEENTFLFPLVVDYTDSKPGAWYYDAVLSCTDKGFFGGTGKGAFSPKGQMTREMFVTVLGRFEGIDINMYPGSSFEDVKEGMWYSPYIEWAAKNNVVSGNGKGKFNGGGAITRQEICVILCNYINKYEITLEQKNALTEFADQDKIADWALEAVSYCQTRGIVSGNNKAQFMPTGKATRAEVAVVFDNLSNSMTPDIIQ